MQGLSRTPSDHMMPDGGCAESLNVHLEDGEVCPTLPPVDKTDLIPVGSEGVYVHKVVGNTFYIAYNRNRNVVLAIVNGAQVDLASFADGETLNSVTSMGNTLLISSTKHVYYCVFFDGKYKTYGTRIPMPTIKAWAESNSLGNITSGETIEWMSSSEENEFIVKLFNEEESWKTWFDAIIASKDSELSAKTILKSIEENAVSAIHKIDASNRRLKVFSAPVMLRYAVKLADGSYVHQSDPIVIGGYNDKVYDVTISYTRDSKQPDWRENVLAKNLFKAYYKLSTFDAYAWKDIIKGIDIFMSEPVANPVIGDELESAIADESPAAYRTWKPKFSKETGTDKENMEQSIIRKSYFYKVASYSIDDLFDKDGNQKPSTIWEGKNLEPMDVNKLVANTAMKDGYRPSDEIIPIGAPKTLNSRVLMPGFSAYLAEGYCGLMGYNKTTDEPITQAKDYAFVYFMKENGQTYSVVNFILNEKGTPRSWLSYQNTHCYKCEVYSCNAGGTFSSGVVVPMQEHPSLNCAYAFWGMGVSIFEAGFATDVTFNGGSKEALKEALDNRFVSYSNELIQSQVYNPYLFPVDSRYTMQDDIIDVATTTILTSSNMKEKYDLFVFTKGGIWSLGMMQDGTFSTQSVISREVAHEGSVSPIDNAVIFVTDKSVMYLGGDNKPLDIAPRMHGRPEHLSDEVFHLLNTWTQGIYEGTLSDDHSTFMAFMDHAKGVYDYAGKRVLFFSEGFEYQYSFILDEMTWHKVSVPEYNFTKYIPLNSYPTCMVNCKDEGRGNRLLDFSTVLDESDETTHVKAIVITRPIALDNPDVYKTISRLRIRGLFDKTRVSYIPLASNDGQHFTRLTSLRGPAWKWFKFIILADLLPNEKISWVDIDYEARWTNRMR